MLEQVTALLLKALVVFVVAKGVPGVRISSFGSAVGVAVVYGLLSWALKGFLVYLTFPFILVSLGVFLLVLNAGLLWLTNKLLSSFEIKNLGSLAITTVGITFGSVFVDYIVPRIF